MFRAILLVSVALFLIERADAKAPPHDLVGVRLDMLKLDVEKQLGTFGEVDYEEFGISGGKQYWKLQEGPYARLAIKFTGDLRVLWVTAYARKEGPRLRYEDIGDLKEALLVGKYYYTWTIPKKKEQIAYHVTARGPDPEYLSSISIFRPRLVH